MTLFWSTLSATRIKRELQNSIWAQIRAFSAQAVFSQIAYIQPCMSICEKRPARKNHRIWFPKPVLQFPLYHNPWVVGSSPTAAIPPNSIDKIHCSYNSHDL